MRAAHAERYADEVVVWSPLSRFRRAMGMTARQCGVMVGLTLVMLLTSFVTGAQRVPTIPRMGVLAAQSPELASHTDGLRRGLGELGFVEGQDIISEWRWARGDVKRFSDLAAELVRLNVDVIVAANDPAIAAAKKATRTIPIVMVIASDPVGRGFVASLAQPGGNVTGLSFQGLETIGKRLEILKEALPNLARAAVLWDPREPGRSEGLKEAEIAARALKVQLLPVALRSPSELEDAFATISRARADALMVQGSSMLFAHRERLAKLAVRNRLPTICTVRASVEAGCLLSYGPSLSEAYARAATYVAKILRGAKPADLPVEQPTKFELVINLTTAKALAISIPQSLGSRADEAIR